MNDNVKILTADTFESAIAGNKPVLVDFWAEWCGPCKMLLPIIDALADDNVGRADICKVDVDGNEELAMRFGVSQIPTIMIFKGGEQVERISGFRQKAQLQELLNKHMR